MIDCAPEALLRRPNKHQQSRFIALSHLGLQPYFRQCTKQQFQMLRRLRDIFPFVSLQHRSSNAPFRSYSPLAPNR